MADTWIFVCKLLLAATFSIASIAKLMDRRSAESTVTSFGIARRFSGTAVSVLATIELLVAAALFLFPQAGAAGAILLLALFTAVIAFNLSRGNKPTCSCFGNLSPRPISLWTVGRNILLLIPATFIAVGAPSFPLTYTGATLLRDILIFVLPIVVVVQLWFSVHLLRQHGRLLLEIDHIKEKLVQAGLQIGDDVHREIANSSGGFGIGEPAPRFALPDGRDEIVDLADLINSNKKVLLVFSQIGCGPCRELLPTIKKWRESYEHVATVVLIANGKDDDASMAFPERGFLRDENQIILKAYRVPATPSAMLIDGKGAFASAVAVGGEAITDLVFRTIGAEAHSEADSGGSRASSSPVAAAS